ncbi:MAG: hypothetical protein JNM95_08020 [Chitinophagaceae bacterium]|nr:hypothetical protein [Chitinophagaceae bacterium]
MSSLTHSGVLSNVQIELLKAFSHNLEDSELQELRNRLAQFFAERMITQANKVWDEKNWSNTEMDNLLNSENKFKNT